MRGAGGLTASSQGDPRCGVAQAELKDAVVIWSLFNPAVPSEGAFARLGWRGFALIATLPYALTSPAGASDGITTLETGAAAIVPEPDTLALLGGALAVFALVMLIRRKRRRK